MYYLLHLKHSVEILTLSQRDGTIYYRGFNIKKSSNALASGLSEDKGTEVRNVGH